MSGFMQLRVWNENAEETADGEIVPQSDEQGEASVGPRWFAYYTAPGYMDRTDYVVSEIGPIDAARECFLMFGDSDGTDPESRRELAQIIRQCRAQGHRS